MWFQSKRKKKRTQSCLKRKDIGYKETRCMPCNVARFAYDMQLCAAFVKHF